VIVTQPQGAFLCPTGSVDLTVSCGPGSFDYLWQWQPAPGAAWLNVIDGVNTDPQGGPIQFTATGARTGTVSIQTTGGTGTAGSHWEKRCIVTSAGGCGSVTSNPATLTVLDSCCDSIDFNNNGVFPEDQDVVDFIDVLAGGQPVTCDPALGCNDIDFNNNDIFPEDQDVVDFFNVLAGGAC
jgi:hypothetical protein